MRKFFALAAVLWITTAVVAGEEGDPRLMALEGEYIVVGFSPQFKKTYQGKVYFKYKEKDTLAVSRVIQGEKTEGTAALMKTPPSEMWELVVRYREKGQEVKAVYLMQTEYDNYIRLTGFVYRPGVSLEKKGLEALFPVIR